MKKKKSSVITFFVVEIILFIMTIMVFITPLMNLNIKFEKFYDEKTGEYVDNVIQIIKNNNLVSLNNDFIENIDDIENRLKTLNEYFYNNKVEFVTLIDCSYKTLYFNNEKTKTTFFTYDVKLENGFGILYIETLESDNSLKLRTIRINPIEKSAKETHDFYGHKFFGTRFYLLILVILLNCFVMYSEYDYLKKATKPKIWLQILMIISIMAIDVNWTSLILNIKILEISIFPISLFSSGIAGDWHLKYYFPIMTILYWAIFRRKEISHDEIKSYKNSEHGI